MNNKDLNRTRRDFMKFMGQTGIAGALLKGSGLLAGMLANRYAQAASGVKRVVFVYAPMGAPVGQWLPTEDGELRAASQAYEGLQSVSHFREVRIEQGGFGLMWKSLAQLRFTSDWTSNTIDHQIATVLGVATPYPALHLGVQCRQGLEYQSFTHKNGQPIVAIENPQLAYEQLFGGADGSLPIHQRAATRQNILDAQLESLRCAQTKLSSEEQRTLEQYEVTLNDFRERLQLAESQRETFPGCHSPALTDDLAADSENGKGSFARDARLQAEIISHALACGLTNVATLQLSDQDGISVGPDLDFPTGMHHAACSGAMDKYTDMVNHVGGCVAYLIKQLQERDDPAVPGTKLLDNTVVLQVSCLGDAPSHSGEHGPNLLATRMPAFRVGAVSSTGQWGITNLQVLQTVAVGLGLERYIGTESHHCIWPCGGLQNGVDSRLLA